MMIVVNGVPKSGTWRLQQYINSCGIPTEPGMLTCDDDGNLVMRGGYPWGEVRSLGEVLAQGDDRVIGAHLPDAIDLLGHKVAFIVRNPRNVVVSRARWQAVGNDWSRTSEPSYRQVGRLLVDAIESTLADCQAFAGWLMKADVVVRFSEFDANASRVSEALDIPCADPRDSFGDNAPWVTERYRGTWSGHHSDWREYWNVTLNQVWKKFGGPEVEAVYGYDNDSGHWPR